MKGFFDIRRDERRTTFAAFGAFLLITTAHTMLETARDALFLAKIPASRLPWMYLIIVSAALLLARLGRSGGRADSKRGIVAVLLVGAGVTASFWRPAAAPSGSLLYVLYVWSGLFASWVMAQLWSLLGGIHTMTQAKRLYGFIGAGAVLGAVLGAVVARGAMEVFAPRTTLLLSAILFAAAALPCLLLTKRATVNEERKPSASDETRMTAGMGLLWENAFARRVLGIVVLSTVTLTFVDYLFKAQLAYHIHDAKLLGEKLANFYAVTNSIALVTQLVVAPWLFRTQGVQRALLFFPTGIVLAAAGVVASVGSLASVYALKGIDGALRYSLHRTSTELLLVPVPDIVRERIKPIVDLVGSRGGQAFASVGILFLVAVGAAKPRTEGAVVITLAVVWLVLVITIRSLYLDVFRETLKTGGLSGKAELPELDAGAYEAIFTGLNSSRDNEVLASLELLAEQHREKLIPALILYHPSVEVVTRALDIFSHRGRTDFVSIADRLNDHPDRDVAAAALLARTTVLPDRMLLEQRLDDECPQVAVTALIALMSFGWIDEEVAKQRIEATLAANIWQSECAMARAIRDLARDGRPFDTFFDDLLVRLLAPSRESPEVQLSDGLRMLPQTRVATEVANAMGVRKKAKFLPALVEMLGEHELRATARAAIAEIPDALVELDHALSAPQVSRTARLQIPRAMTRFAGREAARLLLAQLVHQTDGALRFKILRALVRTRRQDRALPLDAGILQQAAEQALDHVTELKRWGFALEHAPEGETDAAATPSDPLRAAHHLLFDLVRDKEVHATQRLFMLLELLYEEDFDDVWRGLRSHDPKRRASSLELVENLVLPPLRARVVELVGERPQQKAPTSPASYESALREILSKGGTTMRTLAQYRALEIGLDLSPSQRLAIEDSRLASSLGRRFLTRARDILNADGRPSRAPA